MPTLEIWVSLHLEKYNIQYVCREQNIQEQHKKKYILTTLVTWRSTMYSRVHQIFEMQITNHHMVRERVEITKMNFKYFYSVSST